MTDERPWWLRFTSVTYALVVVGFGFAFAGLVLFFPASAEALPSDVRKDLAQLSLTITIPTSLAIIAGRNAQKDSSPPAPPT